MTHDLNKPGAITFALKRVSLSPVAEEAQRLRSNV